MIGVNEPIKRLPMEDNYEECPFGPERLEDEELFSSEVVGEDVDLMLVDCLLREAFGKQR